MIFWGPRMKNHLAIAAAAALLLGASHAAAAEFVTNGGFETGDLTGWTQVGANSHGYTQVTGGGVQYAGNHAIEEGNYSTEGFGGVSQALNTVANGVYQISLFWATSNSNDVNSQALQVLWNGVDQAGIFGAAEHGYIQLLYTVTGAGHDTLTVQGFSDHGFNYVDDISVTGAANGPGANGVPEPATWALLLSGFGLAGATLRRRKAAMAA